MSVEIWGKVRESLQAQLGPQAFGNWIDPLHLERVEEGAAHFSAPTRFAANWVQRHYGEKIQSLWGEHGQRIERVIFGHSAAAQPKAQPAAAPAEMPVEKDLPSLSLQPNLTFDTFVVGKPNALANAAARRVAEGGEVSFNPLFFYSGVGLGKTHLMHAIGHEVKAKRPEAKVLFVSAEQFMNRFIQALRFKDMYTFKELFRSVDLLMVDDVQFIAGKESTQEEFFHTFNALVENGKQVVLSADKAPGEIDGLEDRIKSRLQCGLAVDLHPADYELRLGILQSKVAMQMQRYPNAVLHKGVLEFLAQRISSNVRVLEGALNRLFADAGLVGREITLDMVQEILADLLRANERKVTIEEIIRKVAVHYNLRMTDMLSARRARAVARPRQIAMYLSKLLTTKSLPEIGRRFGGRDHTTVIHAVKKVEELQRNDFQIAEDVELLRRMLEA